MSLQGGKSKTAVLKNGEHHVCRSGAKDGNAVKARVFSAEESFMSLELGYLEIAERERWMSFSQTTDLKKEGWAFYLTRAASFESLRAFRK
jgi:hypothetical protein